VRRVRMYDIHGPATEGAAERERCARITLEGRRTVYDFDSLRLGTLSEWLAGASRDDHRVSPPRELGGEPEHLPLTASPTSFGIDVEYAHRQDRWGTGEERRKLALSAHVRRPHPPCEPR
jgi:hypothetical protein